jgi:protein-disulfide isomerase
MTPKRLFTLAVALTGVIGLAACNNAGGGAGGSKTGSGLSAEGYSIGDPKAAVTVIEYGSLTCPHCAKWEDETWPGFKAKYVDSGKVYFIFREFLIHPEQDAAGALLARCVSPDKYFATVQGIFRTQPQIFAGDTRGALLHVAQSEGMTEAQFNSCLSNTEALKGVGERQQKALDEFRIESTPTFIINGKKYDTGEISLDKLSEQIDPLLKK